MLSGSGCGCWKWEGLQEIGCGRSPSAVNH